LALAICGSIFHSVSWVSSGTYRDFTCVPDCNPTKRQSQEQVPQARQQERTHTQRP
jgi:hypothetical protein